MSLKQIVLDMTPEARSGLRALLDELDSKEIAAPKVEEPKPVKAKKAKESPASLAEDPSALET